MVLPFRLELINKYDTGMKSDIKVVIANRDDKSLSHVLKV